MNILDGLKHFLFTIISAVPIVTSSVFPSQPTPTYTPTPTPITVIKATGSYSYNGYKANITLRMPKNGGGVTGSIDGDCKGKITDGAYSGSFYDNNPGYFSANAKGECDLTFITIDAAVKLHGTIYPESKTGSLDFVGTAGGVTQKGTIKLELDNPKL